MGIKAAPAAMSSGAENNKKSPFMPQTWEGHNRRCNVEKERGKTMDSKYEYKIVLNGKETHYKDYRAASIHWSNAFDVAECRGGIK